MSDVTEQKNNQFSENKGMIICCSFYFVIFFAEAVRGSFLSLYLNNAGLSSNLVGIINGIVSVLGVFIYPLWGTLSDRAKTKNNVLIIGLICSIITLVIFSRVSTTLMLGIMMIVYSLCYMPQTGIYETVAMDYVSRTGKNYGFIRMSGTIGYAVMAVIAGWWLTRREGLIFPILIGSMIAATTIALWLPKAYRKVEKKEKNGNIYALLKNKRILYVLIMFAVYNTCNGFNMTYYGIFMSEIGGTYTLVGVANMIMALAEIPFHIGPGRRFMKKIGIENSLLIVTVVGVIRWALVGVCRSPWLLVVTMAFNGIMLVPTIVGVVEYLYNNAPEGLKTSAQAGLKSLFTIISTLIANFGGGALVGLFNSAGMDGIRTVYLILSPISLLTAVVIGFALRAENKKDMAK